VLGDTNTAMSAYMAKRLGIDVFHIESGNRAFDKTMPEEINRRLIDHISDVHMCYTQRSKENLYLEGIRENVYVVGNPITEVLQTAKRTDVLDRVSVKPKKYFLLTAHRFENVTNSKKLLGIVAGIKLLETEFGIPVIFSCHENTGRHLETLNCSLNTLYKPFGFNDFTTLEKDALCILTDSGTVQEEACIYGVPCVTLRDNTERPETIECGANILSGVDPISILKAVKIQLRRKNVPVCPEYAFNQNVSDTIINIFAGVK
jgi:UDP-N-acetylglucosamine 2-epimerase (non-hydrolysing)